MVLGVIVGVTVGMDVGITVGDEATYVSEISANIIFDIKLQAKNFLRIPFDAFFFFNVVCPFSLQVISLDMCSIFPPLIFTWKFLQIKFSIHNVFKRQNTFFARIQQDK